MNIRRILVLHRPLLCSCRILVLHRRPSLCCRPWPLRLWTLRLPRRRRAQRWLPTAARSYQAGVGGAAEAGMECEPTNPALFLVADLCCRVGPACFFPAPSRASFPCVACARFLSRPPASHALPGLASHAFSTAGLRFLTDSARLITAARLNERVNAPNV
jgi:hypothetical protein